MDLTAITANIADIVTDNGVLALGVTVALFAALVPLSIGTAALKRAYNGIRGVARGRA